MLNGREVIGMADAPHRPARRRLLPRGARHLRQPESCEENLMLPPQVGSGG
jgi:hypothetical protein